MNFTPEKDYTVYVVETENETTYYGKAGDIKVAYSLSKENNDLYPGGGMTRVQNSLNLMELGLFKDYEEGKLEAKDALLKCKKLYPVIKVNENTN